MSMFPMSFSQGYKDSNQENPIAETATELDISSFNIQNACGEMNRWHHIGFTKLIQTVLFSQFTLT